MRNNRIRRAERGLPYPARGLGRLEYRGYDSAGIATIVDNGKLEIRRAKGKLENLRHLLADSPLHGHIGIGHTRWATHGRPSEENAHPHKAGPVAVIHNGIVENFVDLRAELLSRGHKLRSETDTELISHLIEEKLKTARGLTEAVREAVLRIRGSFSIVVLSETEPGKLVAAKTATPMVLGLGDGENFIASDIPAILEHTRSSIVLEDGELAEVTASAIRLMKFDGTAITRAPRQVEWDAVAATKAGFRHYLRKEINEQPQAWIDTMAGRADGGSSTVRFEGELLPQGGPKSIGRIVMLGAGASWITALVGKFMIEHLAGIPVEVDYSSEFRYRRPPIDERTMIIAVSQSGETADTIAAMEEGRARGTHLLAITNTVDSSIARKANAQLYTRCGPETSVTTTKCFLTQLEAYYLFAIHLAARMGRISEAIAGDLLQPALAIPGQIKAIFESEPNIQQIARKYAQAQGLPVPRPRHQLPDRARGRAQAEGNFVHPRRRLLGGRDEARADRAYRRQDAGGGDNSQRRAVREVDVEPEGSGITQRPDNRGDQSCDRRARKASPRKLSKCQRPTGC